MGLFEVYQMLPACRESLPSFILWRERIISSPNTMISALGVEGSEIAVLGLPTARPADLDKTPVCFPFRKNRPFFSKHCWNALSLSYEPWPHCREMCVPQPVPPGDVPSQPQDSWTVTSETFIGSFSSM